MINIIPLNDDREHEFAVGCWCEPQSLWQDRDGTIYHGGPIVVHNAADCREQVEQLLGEGVGEDKRWVAYYD